MTKKSKLYTRGGDTGTTQLVSGNRVEKNNPRIETYGTIDELNSAIGLLASLLDDKPMQTLLHAIQNKLFDMGAYLATDPAHWTLKGVEFISKTKILKRLAMCLL